VRDAGGARLIRRGERAADDSLRRILLVGQDVDYRLIRARRQSIGMTIDHTGLVVRAPHWVRIREIEVALKERAHWVVEMLAQWRGRNRESLPTAWQEGAPLLFQGRALTLALFPARRQAIAADLLHLTVLHPTPGDEGEIAAFCRRWLKEQALALLAPRALHFARRLRTRPPSVQLSDVRSQWGSCNHRGEIRLNWRLVQLPPRIADYVVAHEVAHLVELNHSARFWALVESLLPGHIEARRELDALTPLLD
jgi:predicted metal-dependent hydrolase